MTLGLGTAITKSNLNNKFLTAIFDGTNDFITVPDDDALSYTSSTGFGISFWINLNGIVSHGIITKNDEYNFYVRTITTGTQKIQFEFSVLDASESKLKLGFLSFEPEEYGTIINQWVHINGEYTTTTQARLFVNNVFGSAASQADFVDIENTTNDLLIGKAESQLLGGGDTTDVLSGAMTNLCFYSGTLTLTERTDIFNAGVSGNFTDHANNSLIAYYPLTSDLNDISGNNHHGSSATGQSPIFDLV